MINESFNGTALKRKRNSDSPVSPAVSDDASSPSGAPAAKKTKNSAAPGDSESESDTVTESAGHGEGEADRLVHARTDAAKAAWTKKLGMCPPSLSNLPLTLVSAIMQQKWHAKSYAHFLSEVAVVWNDKQDRWEQQFTCTWCVSSFS